MRQDNNLKHVKVIAPLFDRLIDQEPSVPSEAEPFRGLTIEELKHSIQREVNYILNTRESKIPFSFRSLNGNHSTDWQGNYGLPDFSSYDVTEIEGSRKLAYHLQQIIENYEPRLINVNVSIIKYKNSIQSLSVSVTGEIHGIPLLERFTFPINIDQISVK
ncbi:MAG: type VI secretion system baseplate subunit TssE [Alphaproteobacteria bacterium]|nr:type VI secretion system baseplate subunit TssE [Alphaproteobacteria bacterium]